MKQQNPNWLKLDNAAKIYPATSSRKSPAQFRLSVRLDSPVKFSAIQAAWQRMIKRCPYFQVYLQRGFFWYYLQRHQQIPPIELLKSVPASTFQPRHKKSHLLRIGVRADTIALDFSHILTDGNGGLRFLLGLIYEYFRQQGMNFSENADIPTPESEPSDDEFEDAFRRYFPGDLPHPATLSSAYHISGIPANTGQYHLISGRLALDELMKLTRANRVSLTEYLVSVYLDSLMTLSRRSARTKSDDSLLRLQVPVNMRNYHPSATMRNFSLYVSPEINLKLGEYSFDEILKQVHHSMQMQLNRKELGRQVSRNVGGELNPLVRPVPLFVKDLYLGGLYRKLGENCYSGVLSNLGPISVDPQIKGRIKSFGFSFVPNNVMKKSCAVLSYDNDLIINFSSAIFSRELERLFFTKLVEAGIHVQVREE